MSRNHGILGALALTVAAHAAPAIALEKLTFQMSWKAQAEQGGYFQAVAKGFYKDCGLDLIIRQGGPGIDPAQLLVSGAIDATLVSQMDSAYHMNKAGFPARAIMAAFQRTSQILMTHPGNGIDSFEDMKGKPIMIAAGSRSTFWPFLRAKYGWNDAQIRSYSGQLAPWLSDRNAIQQGLITNEPFLVKRETGETPKVFLLADYGYLSYGSIVTVSQDLIDKKPDAVRCLAQGSIRGWTDYLDDPKAGFDLIKSIDPSNTDDLMGYTYSTMKAANLVATEETRTRGFGLMTDDRWKAHFSMLVEAGVLPADMDYRAAFTLAFLPKPSN
jgi:NitT/TauT family transport system substrate-binding protein